MLFLGKKDNFYAIQAGEFIKQHFPEAEIVFVERTDTGISLDKEILPTKRDYIISFLSPFIVPKAYLTNTTHAINFHPGSPDYPGTGCTNFAIYDGVKEYGVTSHLMAPKVDSGQIINVMRFPIHETDTVYSLTEKCYGFMLMQFYVVVGNIVKKKPIQYTMEEWSRPAYKMKEFQKLRIVTKDMSQEEIQRRIKATTYPGYPSVYMEDE